MLALYPNALMLRVGRLKQTLGIAQQVLGSGYMEYVVRPPDTGTRCLCA